MATAESDSYEKINVEFSEYLRKLRRKKADRTIYILSGFFKRISDDFGLKTDEYDYFFSKYEDSVNTENDLSKQEVLEYLKTIVIRLELIFEKKMESKKLRKQIFPEEAIALLKNNKQYTIDGRILHNKSIEQNTVAERTKNLLARMKKNLKITSQKPTKNLVKEDKESPIYPIFLGIQLTLVGNEYQKPSVDDFGPFRVSLELHPSQMSLTGFYQPLEKPSSEQIVEQEKQDSEVKKIIQNNIMAEVPEFVKNMENAKHKDKFDPDLLGILDEIEKP
jgi:hypothetical protein